MLIPSIICLIVITLFVLWVRLRKKHHFSEKESWNIVDSLYEEWPKRPNNLPKEKNKDGIYLDRLAALNHTEISFDRNGLGSFSIIADEPIKSWPLYTTEHSNEEHFLTTIHMSFHIENDQFWMDILSLDKDFPLKNNNQFSLRYVNGVQWDFVFSQENTDEYAASIPLSKEQLSYLSDHRLDKWRLRRDKDDYFTVGALNFEIRKYLYKPDIQYIIQLMAQKMIQSAS